MMASSAIATTTTIILFDLLILSTVCLSQSQSDPALSNNQIESVSFSGKKFANNNNNNNNNNNDNNNYGARILTKTHNITAYEGSTVLLPCAIQNVQTEHVIWQHGKRGLEKQTLLYIDQMHIEKNYRMRTLTFVDDDYYRKRPQQQQQPEQLVVDADSAEFQPASPASAAAAAVATSGSSTELVAASRVKVSNLEIRRLQIDDSGWYECQVTTYPTQINYIYLQVYGMPRLAAHNRPTGSLPVAGEPFELQCEITNMPKGLEPYWTKDDKAINASVTIVKSDIDSDNNQASLFFKSNNIVESGVSLSTLYNFTTGITTVASPPAVKAPSRHLYGQKIKANHVRQQQLALQQQQHSRRHSSNGGGHHHGSGGLSYLISTEHVGNKTLSRLRVKHLGAQHRGVYKCKYDDRAEAKFHLDFKDADYKYSSIYQDSFSAATTLKMTTSTTVMMMMILGCWLAASVFGVL